MCMYSSLFGHCLWLWRQTRARHIYSLVRVIACGSHKSHSDTECDLRCTFAWLAKQKRFKAIKLLKWTNKKIVCIFLMLCSRFRFRSNRRLHIFEFAYGDEWPTNDDSLFLFSFAFYVSQRATDFKLSLPFADRRCQTSSINIRKAVKLSYFFPVDDTEMNRSRGHFP